MRCDDTRTHRLPGEQLWVPRAAIDRSYREGFYGTPREGSGLLSMQPVGCTPWCSTERMLLLRPSVLPGLRGLQTHRVFKWDKYYKNL